MRRCPACGKPVRPKPPGEPGPAKTYCGDACRAAAYRPRHPLGSRLLAELGIPDRSPLQMLRDQGADLSGLRLFDAWAASQRRH